MRRVIVGKPGRHQLADDATPVAMSQIGG
jgi:hypothetical protein